MRVALVTGGNRGLGHEVCRQLADLGYHVILTARDEQVAIQSAEKLHHSVHSRSRVAGHQLDVTSDESVRRLMEYVATAFGRLDVLINNAGVFPDNERDGKFPSLLEMEVDVLQQTMETNLYGPLRLIKACFPLMQRANYGRIVNVSSGMGRLTTLVPVPDDLRRDPRSGPFYRISKSALNALTRIVAAEAHGCNILVNAVCPGWVKTRMGTAEAVRTVEEGARGIIWAATLSDGGPTGGFFRDGKPLDW